MTEKRKKKTFKLAYEILGLIAVSALIALVLFFILTLTATVIVDSYLYDNDIVLSELDRLLADRWIYTLSGIISTFGFCILFMALLSDRITYIRTITEGINALRLGKTDSALPLEGRNELTQLADSINYMSATQKQLREKEQALTVEKEQFIRALSHDIRTPLTSILAYSEYLSENDVPKEEQKAHLQMMRKKAEQIRDLTGLLLDSNDRNPEHFPNAHLLIEQLAAEFEEDIEERFSVKTDLSRCPAFEGTFDVRELRRIFDNLSSNVHKYADPQKTVCLSIGIENGELCIRQTNAVLPQSEIKDSYKLGLNSIRRIAQGYGGRVSVISDAKNFSITVILSDF